MSKNQTQQKPAKESKLDKLPADHPLRKAHKAAAARREELSSMSDTERAKYDLTQSVRKAADALTMGRGNVANRLRSVGDTITTAEREKIVAYLESQVEEVRKAAYGKKDERTAFTV